MYMLTLTKGERAAFDWVGHRYGSTGEDMARLIRGGEWGDADKIVDWDYNGEITFAIPEHIAWQMNDLAEEDEHSWPCFAPELAAKMELFLDKIV